MESLLGYMQVDFSAETERGAESFPPCPSKSLEKIAFSCVGLGEEFGLRKLWGSFGGGCLTNLPSGKALCASLLHPWHHINCLSRQNGEWGSPACSYLVSASMFVFPPPFQVSVASILILFI